MPTGQYALVFEQIDPAPFFTQYLGIVVMVAIITEKNSLPLALRDGNLYQSLTDDPFLGLIFIQNSHIKMFRRGTPPRI